MQRIRRIQLLLFILILFAFLGYRWHWFTSPPATIDALTDSHFPFTTEADPAAVDADAIDFIQGTPFTFVWGDGSGWHGFDVVKVQPDGVVIYTFHAPKSPGGWLQATFPLDAKTQLSLRQLLASINYWRMKKAYMANVADGTQRFVKVEIAGHRKAVWCDNVFPPELMQIKRFVETRILAPNATSIGQAKSVTVTPQNMEHETFD